MRADPERHRRFLERVEPHRGAIRKVAALYARDTAEREDLFQEILLQLWRSFDAFRGDSAFSTFLYRVALNTALLRVRRACSRPALETGRTLDDLAGVPAREREERDADVERLYAAIRRLAPLDRAVVLLVLEERSHEEIAAVTGLSVGTVSVRLFRAKARLRVLLNDGESAQEGASCSTTR